jgi:Ca-activated chloride channel family protein
MTFQWPYLLLSLALLPVLAALYVLAQRRRRAYAVRFTNMALLSEVVGRGPGMRRHIPPLLYLFGLGALLVSLARPTAVIAVPRDQTTAMLVMDVSASMTADDLRPNRMQAAKQAALAFVDALPQNIQVGLVTFSSSASVNIPLTRDRDAVQRAITGLRANGGTAIGEGLHLALDQLGERAVGPDGKPAPALVVLMSDGQSSLGRPPDTAAARAKSEQVKVYTIGVGERGRTTIIGGNQRVGLDEATLQNIARETGGEYFYAADTNELKQVYADLGSAVSWVEERTEVTALVSAAGALLLVLGGMLSLRWLQQLP